MGYGLGFSDCDAALIEYRQKHNAIFNDNVPQQSGVFRRRPQGMNALIAQECVKRCDKALVLLRDEALSSKINSRFAPPIFDSIPRSISYRLYGFAMQMFQKAS